MGTTSPDLHLDLDRSRPRGLRVQIEDGIRAAIRGGRVRPGDRMPSTRALAGDLGVTRRVVVEAYDQLVAEGFLGSRQGAGTVVNEVPRPRTATRPQPPKDVPVQVDFRPGRPDHALFPLVAWGRAGKSALATMTSAEFADTDQRGLPRLRHALADYLARVRGVVVDPGRIVVCSGFGHAFELVARALPGHRFAVEDPGYPAPRAWLHHAQCAFDAVPVDADGIEVDALRRTAARVVAVTPAHQSPTGVAMTPQRRHELVAWARDVEGWVIEDDFDAEFRYDRRPVGALHGLAPDRVVYVGTTAKTLASGVRIGWAVLPEPLVDAVCRQRAVSDGSTSTLLQATFAELVTAGDLDRHLRRARRIYRTRRDAVVEHVTRLLPGAEPSGIAAGLNVVLTLPAGIDENALVTRAQARGVQVYPRAPFHVRAENAVPGLVLGYGSVPPERAALGVRLLAEAFREIT